MSNLTLMEEINKRYGINAVMLLGQKFVLQVPVLSTGILPLDVALGVGGLPYGRIVEVYGPEGSGKTTVCLKVMASAQKQGKKVGFVDTENALDPTWAKVNGVDIDDLMLSQPDSGEDSLGIVEMMVLGGTSVVVIDSVAALVPRAELSGDMGDAHVGLQARLMSQALRKLSSVVRRMGTILIFTNQIREKIGITWGSNETTPGGRALRFYASVRLDCRKVAQVKDGEAVVGSQHTIKVVKNKVAPPFKIAECALMFESGFDEYKNLVDLAIDHKVVKKSGSWFSYGDQQIGQGKESVIELMKGDKDWFDAINDGVRQKLLPETVKEKTESVSDEQVTNEQKLNRYRKKLKLAKKEHDKIGIEKYIKLVEKYEKKVNR